MYKVCYPPPTPPSSPTFVVVFFTILTGVRWHLSAALIYISFMVNIFSCFCWLFVLFLTTVYSIYFPIYQLDYLFLTFLYSLDINPLSYKWLAKIFFHSVNCLFIPVIVSLLCRSFLIWRNTICQFLLLFPEQLESYSESCYLCLSSTVSSCSFRVLGLTLRSLIHIKLIL
jgi:hypothetical protein